MALRETLAIALDTLRAHKMRSFLTLLGVILAVATLVAVMSVLNGLNVYVAEKVANLGANAYVVDRVGVVTNFEQWNKARKRPPLQMSDLEALQADMKLATNISGLMQDIFTSEWFYDENNIGVRIKSPVELLAGIRRLLPMQLEKDASQLLFQRALGQILFYPPNVAGWPGGKSCNGVTGRSLT